MNTGVALLLHGRAPGLAIALRVMVASAVAAIVLFAVESPPPRAHAATFTVNSLADDPDAGVNGVCQTAFSECTLRAAITEANAASGADTIAFDGGALPHPSTFAVGATTGVPLPNITSAVTIDGTSVLYARLDGGAILSSADGLHVTSGGSSSGLNRIQLYNFTDDGLHIDGASNVVYLAGSVDLNDGNGVRIDGGSNNSIRDSAITQNAKNGVRIGGGSTGNVVLDNVIGTDCCGDLGNGEDGVHISESSGNTIGSLTGFFSVISGNDNDGIEIIGFVASNNVVTSNLIGTHINGTSAIPNGQDGVRINAKNNIIGGTTAFDRNIISGNAAQGVYIVEANGVGVTGNVVQGNYIGTNSAGTSAVGNAGVGVAIEGAVNNLIGGTVAGAGNLIAGQTTANGVLIQGATATQNRVQGNTIGAAGMPNASGVLLNAVSNNAIGGTSPGAANVITGNSGDGITVVGASAIGGRLRRNLTYANGGTEIDLNDDGRTVNDGLPDPDSGPNSLQNFPVLNANRIGAAINVSGILGSAASATFAIDMYASASCASGEPTSALAYLGSTIVTTLGSGFSSFDIPLVGGDAFVYATATDAFGNTSELTDCVATSTTSPCSGDMDCDGFKDEQFYQGDNNGVFEIGDVDGEGAGASDNAVDCKNALDDESDGFIDQRDSECGDRPAPSDPGGVNMNTQLDSCPVIPDSSELNNDGAVRTSLYLDSGGGDDTSAAADNAGDFCDADDDNDGLTDDEELEGYRVKLVSYGVSGAHWECNPYDDYNGGTPFGELFGTLNAHFIPDLDNDGARDGVECELGSDPTNSLSPSGSGCIAGATAPCKVSVPERCTGAGSTAWAYSQGTGLDGDDDRDGLANEGCPGLDTDNDLLHDAFEAAYGGLAADSDTDDDSAAGASPALRDGGEAIYIGSAVNNNDGDGDDCVDTIEMLDINGSTAIEQRNPRVSGTDASTIYAVANYNKTVGIGAGYNPVFDVNHDGKVGATDAGILYSAAFYNKQCSSFVPG